MPFLERARKTSLAPMLEQADALLVFGSDGVALRDEAGALRFSPGMAKLRIKRLDSGVLDDTLVRVASFVCGETVLDCTLGLGADALVAARAVGVSGQVIGLEKSQSLFALVSAGMESHDFGPRSCRVRTLWADASTFLAHQPARSIDCVLFDPMFGRPRPSSPAFEMMRRHADRSPLTREMIKDARRVARRVVVVKGARYSEDLSKLDLAPERTPPSASVAWARIAPA